MSKKNSPRTKIGLEILEAREMLSVTLMFNHGVLTFTGDAGSDTVRVVDTGLAGGGQLLYQINSGAWQTVGGEVWRVALNMGGGTDTVIYNLGRSFSATGANGVGTVVNGKVPGLYREIEANLGDGNDTFTATVHGNVVGPNGMRVLANRQQGNDTITGTLNGDVRGGAHMGFSFHGGDVAEVGAPSQVGVDFINVFMTADVDVDANSVLWANVSGGGGNDNVQLTYQGELDGHLSFNLEGQGDSDWVRANIVLDAGSTGFMGGGNYGRSILNGGDGDGDSLDYLITDRAAAIGGISADAFGGAGNDTLTGGTVGVRLYGEAGNDTLTGGAGADLLDGGTGNDLLFGGAGNDTILGGAGADLLDGGAGVNVYNSGATDGRRVVYLNFDGATMSASQLRTWAGNDWNADILDSRRDGITVQAFLPGQANREGDAAGPRGLQPDGRGHPAAHRPGRHRPAGDHPVRRGGRHRRRVVRPAGAGVERGLRER